VEQRLAPARQFRPRSSQSRPLAGSRCLPTHLQLLCLELRPLVAPVHLIFCSGLVCVVCMCAGSLPLWMACLLLHLLLWAQMALVWACECTQIFVRTVFVLY